MLPTALLMPHSVTILRAIVLARWMSLLAPVETSWMTISSAALPPSIIVIMSISLPLVTWLSSLSGRVSV